MATEIKTTDILKRYGMTDDEIIAAALIARLTDAASFIIGRLKGKVDITRLQAMDLATNVKKEFE